MCRRLCALTARVRQLMGGVPAAQQHAATSGPRQSACLLPRLCAARTRRYRPAPASCCAAPSHSDLSQPWTWARRTGVRPRRAVSVRRETQCGLPKDSPAGPPRISVCPRVPARVSATSDWTVPRVLQEWTQRLPHLELPVSLVGTVSAPEVDSLLCPLARVDVLRRDSPAGTRGAEPSKPRGSSPPEGLGGEGELLRAAACSRPGSAPRPSWGLLRRRHR